MKTLKYFFYVLLVSVLAVACDEREYDIPSIAETGPVYTGDSANYTIKQLKDTYSSDTPTEIEDNLILKAYVTANDESGNLYKQLYIQDETGGIQLSIDKSGLSSAFKVGQEVFVLLKGLYVGKYGGVSQIGKPGDSGIGRMSADELELHVFRNGLPKIANAAPETVTLATAETTEYIGRLIRIENLTFNNAGKGIFAPQGTSAQSEVAKDKDGKTIEVRTSSYANFAGDSLPEGPVTLTGIMGKYNSTWQFTLRTRDDISVYVPEPGQGASNPYDVTAALTQEYSDVKFWTKGYIVGTVADGVNATNPIDAADDIELNADFGNTTILLAADAAETDWTKMLVVNLPSGSPMRTALNLMDKPENKGKEVTVYGNAKEYFGAHSINIATGSAAEYVFEGQGGEQPPTGEGAGTKEDPYNVAKAISRQNLTPRDSVWVEGYIVGAVKNGITSIASAADVLFAAPFDSNTNVLIADTQTETDYNKCVVVNLPSGTALRTQVNLSSNAGNLGAKLNVIGNLRTYFGVAGLRDAKGTTDAFVLGENVTPEPPDPLDPETGDGTQANPWNVTQGIATQGSTVGWVQGYIVGAVKNGITSIASAADVLFAAPFDSQTNVLIADSKTETDYTKCIAVNLPSGKDLRTLVNLVGHPENLGATLKVNGTLRTYFGIAGLRDSNGTSADFTLTGVTPPPAGNDLFNETLMTQASFDKFTPISVVGDLGWTFDARYGAVMSGYDNATTRSYANEDWLISPAINLSAASSATLTFDHARGPASSMSVATSNYTVWVSTNYTGGAPSTATWTPLPVPTHGTTAWAYVSSGDIAIPAANLAATTRIAFKYVCDDTESATWEVKNVVIK
ncbi:MAG: DUF6359 domain-containing protein [Prevotella sp.]|jgi:DNA/RNA endonuclease YhcR with UshA esterase domain|nr:DUF6359 domain-containing protein [Prevotella sp.]